MTIVNIVLLVTLLSCNNATEYPWVIRSDKIIKPVDDSSITLALNESTLSEHGAEFTLQNEGRCDFKYGNEYYLQVYTRRKWHEIEIKWDWTLELYTISPSERKLISFDWQRMYGSLPNGQYRIIYRGWWEDNYDPFFIACEFSIEDNQSETKTG